MTDLISVLVLTYVVQGTAMENEISMAHHQCMAAERAISKASRGPRKGRPTVELVNGQRVPLLTATCVPACFSTDDSPLPRLKDEA